MQICSYLYNISSTLDEKRQNESEIKTVSTILMSIPSLMKCIHAHHHCVAIQWKNPERKGQVGRINN